MDFLKDIEDHSLGWLQNNLKFFSKNWEQVILSLMEDKFPNITF